MKKTTSRFNKQLLAIAAITIIAVLAVVTACVPGAGTTSSGAASTAGSGFPYISTIMARIVPSSATPGATASPGATVSPAPAVSPSLGASVTPGATSAVTPGATSAATPGATASPSAVATPSATASVVPGVTSTPIVTASPTPGVTPGATTTPVTGGSDVMISIQAANFNVVNKLGQAAVPGEGHVHFYLDATPPITAGVPAVSAPGTYTAVAATSYTWPNVKPGLHVFSVQLANNDHTPLSVPAVASVLCVVPQATDANAPEISMLTTQIMGDGSAAVTPGATSVVTPGATNSVIPGATSSVIPGATSTATPGATAAASPGITTSPTGATPGAAAVGGVSVTQSVQISDFTIVDKQGQPGVGGQGHIHFYMDAVPPTFPNQPAVTGAGTYVHITAPSYTWNNVQPGVHIFAVELVNNDHTPLNPPVVQVALVTVMPPGSPAASPAASPSPSPTAVVSPATSPSPSVSPATSPSPTVAVSPIASPIASPAVSPAPTSTGAAGGAATINLTAQNVAFNMQTITVKAGAQVTVNFNNMDAGIPHNFSVYNNQSMSQVIFKGDIITGPATKVYTFTAPSAPGTYFFVCDVHPTTMTGQFIVQ